MKSAVPLTYLFGLTSKGAIAPSFQEDKKEYPYDRREGPYRNYGRTTLEEILTKAAGSKLKFAFETGDSEMSPITLRPNDQAHQ